MARQLPNDAFAKSSFLYGGNATYVEQLYDDYRRDPTKVDPSWRQFFEGLKDESSLVEKNAEGASWKQRDWPVPLNGELVSALDGNWLTIEQRSWLRASNRSAHTLTPWHVGLAQALVRRSLLPWLVM